MRKRLNIKLLVGLICGSLAFIIGVYLLHGFQVERNADGLRRRADVARDAGDLDESVRLRRRYLAHKPEDAVQFKQIALEAKKNLFAKVEQRQVPQRKDVELTIFLMEEATRKNPTDKELRRDAADLWFAMKRYNDAVSNLKVIETEWSTEDKLRYIECLRLKGGPAEEEEAIKQLWTMIGFDEDSEEFDVENAENPEMLDAYQSLILLLMNSRLDRDLAEKTVNQMVKANEDNYESYLSRSRLIRLIRGADGSEISKQDIRTAFELAPDNVDVMSSMAQMYMQDGQLDQAKQLVIAGLETAETLNAKSRLYNLLAQIHITDKDTEGALKVLEEANRIVPTDRDLLWTKARLLLDDKKFDEVEKMYKPLEKAQTDAPMIAYLQARILMEKGDYHNSTKALARIRELVSPMLQYDIDVYLSAGYGMTKQYDLRLETIKRILKVSSGNTNAHEQLINTLMALGRNSEAMRYTDALISELESKGLPVSDTLSMVRTQLMMTRDLSEATTILSSAELKQIQKDLLKHYNNENIPEAQRHKLLIDYFRKVNDPVRAKQAIDEALVSDPTSFPFWALRIDYSNSEQEASEVFERMVAAVDPKFESTIRPMKAKIAMKFAPDTANAVIQEQEKNVDHFTPQEQAGLFYELGMLQLFLENRNDGIRLLEMAGEKDPTRIDILTTLFTDATRQSDPKRINEIINRIKDVTGPEDDTWRMAEAGRIVWMIRSGNTPNSDRGRQINQARALMQVVHANRPEHVPVLLLESEIQHVSGDVQAAIKTLEGAHALQPANPTIIRMIAQYNKDLGNSRLVDEWMRKLPLSMRSDRDKRVELNTLWQRKAAWTSSEAAKAVQLANEITPTTSTTASDWLLKSQVLLQANQLEEAEQSALKAKELEIANPDVWTNLVSILVSQNKQAQAQELLQEVEVELSEGIKHVVLGRCYAILKNYHLAKTNLITALRADPKNTLLKRMISEIYMAERDSQNATVLVKEIIDESDPIKDKAQLEWARRQMARVLSSTESYAAFQQGLELIEQNAVNGELSNKDVALWVFLCYMRPEKISWDKALIRLEQVAKRRPLNDDEMFMKAQLYEKYGDEAHWQEAKSMTISVLSRNPGNPKVIENYVKWLLKRGKVREAKQIATNSMEQTAAIRLLVELHSDAKEGRFQQALKKIQDRRPKDPSSREELSTLLTLALMSEELGQYNEGFYKLAEQMLADLTKKVPSEVLRLATTMGLHGDVTKIKKALGYCMSADKVGVADPFRTGVAIAILREHSDKWTGELAPAVNTVEKWLQQIVQANPDNVAVQWRLAEFHDMMGNLDLAEANYMVLLSNPKFENPYERGMVLNNTAYVMALNGNGIKPLEMLAEAEQLLGPTADLLDTRGYAYYVLGDLSSATQNFRRAIEIGPETAHKLFHLTLVLDKQGDGAARDYWARATKLGLTKSMLPKSLQSDFDRLEVVYSGTPQL